MDEKKQELIDRYIKDEMAVEERRQFEKLLSEDAELQEQYEFTRQLQEALKSRMEKMNLMKQWEDEEAEPAVRKAGHRKTLWRIVASVAAVVVISVSLYMFIQPSTQVKMPSLNESYGDVYRSSGELSQVKDLILEKRYAEALQMIDSLEKWTQVDEKNGVKATMSDEERERIQYEQEVELQEADRLKWLKVYALMGLERREEALQLLDELRCSNGIYQRKADSLYRLIK